MGEKKLSGKVAVITGGARGLGRGYALRLARLGADIAVIDRNLRSADVYAFEKEQMTADTVKGECEALGVRAIDIEADVSDRETTERVISEVAGRLGRIDIAICNAGGGTTVFADERDDIDDPSGSEGDINTTGTPADCAQESLDRVLGNNLLSCMYTCMAVAPYMKKQRSGKIVTVSSTAGLAPGGAYHPYGMAKAAIVHYTRSLAKELGSYHINVNCIAPGIIRTGRLGDRSKLAAKAIPFGREGTIEECAGVVEFLVTDLSDYVTGSTVTIDGGEFNLR